MYVALAQVDMHVHRVCLPCFDCAWKLIICRLTCNALAVALLHADLGLTVSFTAEQAQQVQCAFVNFDMGDLLASAEYIQRLASTSADASSGRAHDHAGYVAMLTDSPLSSYLTIQRQQMAHRYKRQQSKECAGSDMQVLAHLWQGDLQLSNKVPACFEGNTSRMLQVPVA